MNLYKFPESLFHLFKTFAAPAPKTANYAEQSARAFENAENDFLYRIRLTEAVNAESAAVPRGFIEAEIPRELAAGVGAANFPVTAVVNAADPRRYAFPLTEKTLKGYEKNMTLAANLLTAQALLSDDSIAKSAETAITGIIGREAAEGSLQTLGAISRNVLERGIGTAALSAVDLPAAAEIVKESSAEYKTLPAVGSISQTAVKNIPNMAYNEAVQTKNPKADVFTLQTVPPISLAVDEQMRNTSRGLAKNAVFVHAAYPEAVQPTGKNGEAILLLRMAENAVLPQTDAYPTPSRIYFNSTETDTNAFISDGISDTSLRNKAFTAADTSETRSLSCDQNLISAEEKELSRLRESAADGAGKQMEERIIGEIRTSALNTVNTIDTLTDLNAAIDTDNVINFLAEALEQSAETGTEGVYR